MDFSENKNIKNFQKHLNNDHETRSDYISAEIDSDSDSDFNQDEFRVVLPKKKKKKGDVTTELVNQLVQYHSKLTNIHKKYYKLQSELDKEEICNRYTKLDLNNMQIKFDETFEKLILNRKMLRFSRLENWITRGVFALYTIFSVCRYFY